MLAAVLFGGCLLLVLIVFVGAVLLRLAVSLYNKWAGLEFTAEAVEQPPLLKAAGIIFVNQIIGHILSKGLGDVFEIVGLNSVTAIVTAIIVSVLITVLIMAGLLSLTLPASFNSAFMITLCYILLALGLAVVVAAVCFVGVLIFR